MTYISFPVVTFTENQLLEELEETKQARQNQEREREGLLKKAKHIQHKTIDRRNEGNCSGKKKVTKIEILVMERKKIRYDKEK